MSAERKPLPTFFIDGKDIMADSIGQLHALRLMYARHQRSVIAGVLGDSGGDTTIELLPQVSLIDVLSGSKNDKKGEIFPSFPDGGFKTQELEVSPMLLKGIERVIFQEREALVNAGFPTLAEQIAPQAKKSDAIVIFSSESSEEAAA